MLRLFLAIHRIAEVEPWLSETRSGPGGRCCVAPVSVRVARDDTVLGPVTGTCVPSEITHASNRSAHGTHAETVVFAGVVVSS